MSRETGLYVPIYQREYTWEEDNVDQLMSDIVHGVSDIATQEHTITFLGTLILTPFSNPKVNIPNADRRITPSSVHIVIDGQQRLATLALLAVVLRDSILFHKEHLSSTQPFPAFHGRADRICEDLERLYAINLNRGHPLAKPRMIRANEDMWTYDGPDENYGSPITSFVAAYIRSGRVEEALASCRDRRVYRNVEKLREWISAIAGAHANRPDALMDFPVGQALTDERLLTHAMGYADETFAPVIAGQEADPDKPDFHACAATQLFFAAFYVLERCGVNVLSPANQEWGFDLFQALNATGTPLTALETFRPLVIQTEEAAGAGWRASPSFQSFEEIDRLFEPATSNEQKTSLTNELLGTFGLVFDGTRLSNRFNEQRKWLESHYKPQELQEKRDFVDRLAKVSCFYYFGWRQQETRETDVIMGLESHDEKNLATFLIRYLREASSKLSGPILARFYDRVLREEEGSVDDFVEAVKACAAFFTLWRSSNSTSGLDDVYRRFMCGSEKAPPIEAHNVKAKMPQAAELKTYFSQVLDQRGSRKKEDWERRSDPYLRFDEVKAVCRFVLFLYTNDTIIDPDSAGLVKVGARGAWVDMLTPQMWKNPDFKSLEHVAPQRGSQGGDWDQDIYSSGLEQDIGNLLLLNKDLNTLVGNRSWKVKYYHYLHVGEQDPDRIREIGNHAGQDGIILSGRAVNMLKKMRYSGAVSPVLELGKDGGWDAEFIRSRSANIKGIVWPRLDEWLT